MTLIWDMYTHTRTGVQTLPVTRFSLESSALGIDAIYWEKQWLKRHDNGVQALNGGHN